MSSNIGSSIENALRFRRAVRFVWQSAPALTAINAFISLLQGAMPFVSLYLFKLLIDAVTVDLGQHGSASATHRVIKLLVYAALASVVTSILRSVSIVTGEHQSQQVTDRMQHALHTKSFAVDLGYYENSEFYDTLHRAQQEAPFRSNRIVSNLTQLMLSAFTLIAVSALVLVTIRWQLAALLIVLSLPGIVVKILFADRLYKWQRSNTVIERMVNYYNFLLTSDSTAKEIRLFNIGDLFIRRSADLRKTLRDGRMKITGDRSLADGVADALSTVAVYVTFGVMAVGAVTGKSTIGTLVVFFQAIQRGQGALRDLLSSVGDLYENNLFLGNLYEFLEMTPKIQSPVDSLQFPNPMKKGIEFRNVTFRYEGTDRLVLDDISFEIRAGETIALVGENGAGKTTLIKLLCRLYEPSSGTISFDGIQISRFNLSDLRKDIAVVFQDYVRYALTARENIWVGNTDLEASGGKVEAAAGKSGADAVIGKLPLKYETQLGYMFEDGVELSTGQWQKIAVARAFFRESQILLLDEPTSSLDAQAEFEVFQAFRELIKGRTAILVSHRLSSVRMADRILVLENGKIVEEGTHDELVSLGGSYARVFETQVNSYTGNYGSDNQRTSI